MPTLIIDVTPSEAAELATIHVDSVEVHGNRIELDSSRVHVSVTAMGFRRYAEEVILDGDKVLKVNLEPRAQPKKSRTLAVTLGMGAIGLVVWLIRRR